MADDVQTDLSEQFLYWAARQHLITPLLKNKPGSLLLYGMRALRDYGICPEADWPYNPTPIAGNEEQGPPPAEAQVKAQACRIQRYVFLWARDVEELKAHLAGGYAIAFTVPTFNYWNSAMVQHTGVVRMPLTTEGAANPVVWLESAHAVCMVGYQDDDTAPGGGYFIIRNSWGTSWASECPDGAGYGWMPYDYLKKYGLTAFTAV
ncbi:MAG: hypothetical protein MAG451_00121 [Anaerolineales bacterium]|nr:hypothetical protein [Anaerolineales bacterium]